jgi:glycine/D-amino acid oxidase-like deaminating enzyme
MGSTAASTALLQYEIDTPLIKLKELVGEKNAIRSYQLCLEAIDGIGNICRRLPEAAFVRRPSLQYASTKKDVPELKREYEARKKMGISLQWLSKLTVKNTFGFEKEAALFSRQAAEVKAYALTHALLRYSRSRALRVYDHTEIARYHEHPRGVELFTTEGYSIRARKLVIACGYESAVYIPQKVQTLQSTYAIVSEPYPTSRFWHRNALIWETARPYLYLRITPDHRILVGGRDDDFSDARLRDKALPFKTRSLETAFQKLFPGISFKTDFKWAGVFASTKDGLPYIGALPGKPHTFFALGFGGNGITFSYMAAKIITNLVSGKKDPDAGIFGFDR